MGGAGENNGGNIGTTVTEQQYIKRSLTTLRLSCYEKPRPHGKVI